MSHLLVEASVQFSQDIYRRTINTSPWLKLIKQSQWPDEMGDTISVLTYERTLPGTANTWGAITSGSTSFAVPTATSVAVAQTIRQFSLKHTAIESQPIVVNDLRMGFRFREQIKAVYDNLVENVAWLWIKRYRDEFRRICGTKVIAATNNVGGIFKATPGSEGYPTDIVSGGANISILTQALLNRLYMELIRDGAGNRPMGMENGRPIFTLVCSPEASDALIRLNPSIRQDFRESSQVNELLKPLGVERSYKGFFHVVDTTCPRYNIVSDVIAVVASSCVVSVEDAGNKIAKVTFSGAASLANVKPGQYLGVSQSGGLAISGGYVLSKSVATGAGYFYVTYTGTPTGTYSATAGTPTFTYKDASGAAVTPAATSPVIYEVPFYVPDFSADGVTIADLGKSTAKRWIVNESYYTAELEESFIVHPEVMESLIPAPISSAGSGTNFNPVNYRGDFKFLNIAHRTENPDGTWGYYRGVLASGSKPNKPQFGMAILSKRIPDVGMFVDGPALTKSADIAFEGISTTVPGDSQV